MLSPTFATTPGAFQTTPASAFVTKFNKTGSELLYSTYLGGSLQDAGRSIAVDNLGNAFVTGSAQSSDFPAKDPIQPSFGGEACPRVFGPPCTDAFVTVLNATGSGLLFSSLLGGSSQDGASGIAVDSSGNILVTGTTLSSDFPITKNAQDNSFSGASDAFVAKIALHDAPILPAASL